MKLITWDEYQRAIRCQQNYIRYGVAFDVSWANIVVRLWREQRDERNTLERG